jgi:hypothetical protein
MAVLLDSTLLVFLLPIFIFLLVFAFIYGILLKTKILGDNSVLNIIAAISIAAVSAFTGNLIKVFTFVTPWITFIFIMLILLFAIFRFVGVEDKTTWETIAGPVVISVIFIIIVFIGLTSAFESDVSPYEVQNSDGSITVVDPATATPGENPTVANEAVKSLTHPRLLGAIFILLVAAFSIRTLTQHIESKK